VLARRLRGAGSGAVAVTELAVFLATRRCYVRSIGPLEGQVGKGGSGGDLAPGVLRSGCRCWGEIEHNTLLWLRKTEQSQVPRRAGTSIVAPGCSFMPSAGRSEDYSGAVTIVGLNTLREACESASITVRVPVSGGFK